MLEANKYPKNKDAPWSQVSWLGYLLELLAACRKLAHIKSTNQIAVKVSIVTGGVALRRIMFLVIKIIGRSENLAYNRLHIFFRRAMIYDARSQRELIVDHGVRNVDASTSHDPV